MELKLNSVIAMALTMLVFIRVVKSSIINDINAPDYDENENYYYGVPVYTPSAQCSSLGGMCVQEEDCAPDQLTAKRGLCQDRDMGVECCYKVKPRPAPCQEFGGECKKWCNPTIRQPLANDCSSDEHCCTLVI